LKNQIKRHIYLGIILQFCSIAFVFFTLPQAIKLLGVNDYGIWVVIYGSINIISNLDLGIGNGIRNELARAFTRKNDFEIKTLISSGFFSLSGLSILIVLLGIITNTIINYLNPNAYSYFFGLINILIIGFGIEMIFKLTVIIYVSNQFPSVTQLMAFLNNLLIFFLTILLNKIPIVNGKIYTYGIFVASIPVLNYLILTIVAFKTKFKNLLPKFMYIDFKIIKSILKKGALFFGIQISMIFLSQISNILILKYSTPSVVSYINISDKYFGLLSIFGSLILFPFWSKFTELDEKNQNVQIKKIIKKLEFVFLLFVFAGIGLYFFMPIFVKLWLKSVIQIPAFIAVLVLAKSLITVLNSVYSYYLNGIGKIKIQLYLYIIFSLTSIPISIGLFKIFGIIGILLFSPLSMLLMSIIQRKSAYKILNQKITYG